MQFSDPLYERLKKTAERRDWSLAELLRRAAEAYLQTIPDVEHEDPREWVLPVLKRSGGYLQDPAEVRAESMAVVEKLNSSR